MSPRPTSTGHAAAALALALSAFAAQADSTSSAASSTSASLGSSSTSLGTSSGSSSSKETVAQGPYTVVAMVAQADQPDRLQLRLAPLAPGAAGARAPADFTLTLPRETAERARLAVGQVITAEHRPYGLAFATRDEPFFLVLDDAWHRELGSRVVGG